MENNQQPTSQRDRDVSMMEARELVKRSDFWRPDTMPTQLQILQLEPGFAKARAGTNKWGRVQIYMPARLEDGRKVTLALSRRSASQLFDHLDDEGHDLQVELPDLILEVARGGRGLETSYSWRVVPKPDVRGCFAGQGPETKNKGTTAQIDPAVRPKTAAKAVSKA